LSIDFKKAKSLKEFPREIPNGFSNRFKRIRKETFHWDPFLEPVFQLSKYGTYQSGVSATQIILASGHSRKE
jgi:hypothetical protein